MILIWKASCFEQCHENNILNSKDVILQLILGNGRDRQTIDHLKITQKIFTSSHLVQGSFEQFQRQSWLSSLSHSLSIFLQNSIFSSSKSKLFVYLAEWLKAWKYLEVPISFKFSSLMSYATTWSHSWEAKCHRVWQSPLTNEVFLVLPN